MIEALLSALRALDQPAEYQLLLDDCEVPRTSDLESSLRALDAWIVGEGAAPLAREEIDAILSELKGSRAATNLPIREYRVVFDRELFAQFQTAPAPRLDRLILGQCEVAYFRDEAQLSVGPAPRNIALYRPEHIFRPIPLLSAQLDLFVEQFVYDATAFKASNGWTHGALLRFVKRSGDDTRYTFKMCDGSPWLPEQVWLRFTSQPRNVMATTYRFLPPAEGAQGARTPVEIVTFVTSDEGISVQSVHIDAWKSRTGGTTNNTQLAVDRCPELRVVNNLAGMAGKGLQGCPPELRALIRIPEGQVLRN